MRAEAGLVAAVVLLRHVVPLLSDKTIIDVLEVCTLHLIRGLFKNYVD